MTEVPYETPATIAEWADKAFGEMQGFARAGERAREELDELIKELQHLDALGGDVTESDIAKAGEEIADVLICIARLAHELGVNTRLAVDAKMKKNRKRRWKRDGSGHGYHVK
jgi:NTP pyrophosphatase (non-canonical NTP hydrolase)